MPRKTPERGKQGHLYDTVTFGKNNAHNLEANLENVMKIAPQMSASAGITAADIAAARRMKNKFGKILDYMYNHPGDIR